MDTPEIVVLVIFGILLLGGLALAIRQGAQTKAWIQQFAASRGFTLCPANDPHLGSVLAASLADQSWYTSNVVQVHAPPAGVYLFAYDYRRKDRPSMRWQGFACLAEHRSWITCPVEIFSRTPGIDALESDRSEAGSEEFRNKFTVTCKRPEVAAAALNTEVEHLLLEHAAGPGWYLLLTVTGNSIVVASSWAKTEVEWNTLITLAKKLDGAIR